MHAYSGLVGSFLQERKEEEGEGLPRSTAKWLANVQVQRDFLRNDFTCYGICWECVFMGGYSIHVMDVCTPSPPLLY